MRRAGRSNKSGRLRWPATALAVGLLAGWLLSAWWSEVAVAGSPGRLALRSGRLAIAYQVHPTLPAGLQVATILDWPLPQDYGVAVVPLSGRGVRWRLEWPSDSAMTMSFSGGTTTGGPGGPFTMTSATAFFYTEKLLPLWPAVLLSLLAAGWSWRRHLRAYGPSQCPRCGYSRAGLAADATCPECGTFPKPSTT